MNSFITTALMGFFLLTGAEVSPEKAVALVREVPIAPTYKSHTVLLTGYNAVPGQTNEDPMTTASGARSNSEVVAARSRDMADILPYGTVVEIIVPEETAHTCGLASVDHLIGYRVMADTMHKRKTNQVDIMFDTAALVSHGGKQKNAAIVLGVCEEIEIRVVGYVDIKHIPQTQTELAAAIGEARLAER